MTIKQQTIVSPKGERLIVLPETEYQALLASAEDAIDAEIVRRFQGKLAAGEEELVPAEFVNRMLDGENAITVWREYRGMTVKALAEKAGISQAYLSQIESRKRDGTIGTMKKIAAALDVSLDDLV